MPQPGITTKYNAMRSAGQGFTRGYTTRHPRHPFSTSGGNSYERFTIEGTTAQHQRDYDSWGWTGDRIVKGFPASKFGPIPSKSKQHPAFVSAMTGMMKSYKMKPSAYSIVHANITEEVDSYDARKRGGTVFYPPGYKKNNAGRNKTFSFKQMHDEIQKEGRDESTKKWYTRKRI